MAMSRQEREGTKLSEAVKLASRSHISILPISSPLARNVANRELVQRKIDHRGTEGK